jgi:hypothetical protein
MESFDFRIESVQQLLKGKLRPLERRAKVVEKRRNAIGSGDIFIPNEVREVKPDEEEESKHEDLAPNTSERASPTGTASQKDIEQSAPKVGASRPEGESESSEDSDESEQESRPATTPSMSEAAGLKMGGGQE